MENINIGSRREVFWDNFIVDTERTTARARVMSPVKKECVMELDGDWGESYTISYPCIIKDDQGYKMYYLAFQPNDKHTETSRGNLCVIESTDGLTWTKPKLGIYKYNGSYDNNIVFEDGWDGTSFMYDPNPDCAPDEKYKAVGLGSVIENGEKKAGLTLMVSPDGYHFKSKKVIASKGGFDSLNILQYINGRYACFYRDFHDRPEKITDANPGKRDVRVIYSDDLETWTEQKQLIFDDDYDIQLYTNNIGLYERAPHIYIGFPTRYCERKEFTPHIDQMPCMNMRRKVAEEEKSPRSALTMNDCIFMCSRDGESWHRYNEAFMVPGYENEVNWVYGDCYPSYGFTDAGDENYNIYTIEKHQSRDEPKPVYRWEIRKDGFACREADYDGAVVVTKPIIFDGSQLSINFSASAAGHIYIDVLDEDGNEIKDATSFEIFGDSIDRKVCLASGRSFSDFSGKTIRLRFRMSDAKIYSFKFE